MRLRWTGLRRTQAPANVVAALEGDRALDWALDTRTGEAVVAGVERLHVVSAAGGVRRSMPWHLVDSGRWDRDTSALVVTFVDRSPTETWTFDLDSEFPISFRARVQASVVLVEVVDLGAKGSARVVVRKDLATQRLLTQAVLGKGVRSTDPGVREALDEALANVKEQVGLD